jgi:hypothetical protein
MDPISKSTVLRESLGDQSTQNHSHQQLQPVTKLPSVPNPAQQPLLESTEISINIDFRETQ